MSDTSPADRQMVFVDIETTGLDPTIHETIEVAWWDVNTRPYEVYDLILPHTLAQADKVSLDINQYHHRELWDRSRWCLPEDIATFREVITGKTLVGANVGAFDAQFLERVTGNVWHHRIVEFESWVMGRLHLPHILSMRDLVKLVATEHDLHLPAPNHTAMGDVYAMQQVWLALQ